MYGFYKQNPMREIILKSEEYATFSHLEQTSVACLKRH